MLGSSFWQNVGGDPKHYLNIPPDEMDNIIKDIELTLDDQEKTKKARKEQAELENKEAAGVKDRSAEGRWSESQQLLVRHVTFLQLWIRS